VEEFAIGDIVLINFPFSDLSGKKLRPALILAKSDFDNLIICQITSQAYGGKNYVQLDNDGFEIGKLPVKSFIRFDKIFTAEPSIITKVQAKIKSSKLKQVQRKLFELFELE
jgi:mRNA interferase MazF